MIQSSFCKKKPFLQMARWLKSEQHPWWERICINVLCTEARLVLFWLCSWDIYEVPDAHYTSLMRNNPGKCWISRLQQCTQLPIMELKLPGNYDWIGLGFLFICSCLFHCQRGPGLIQLHVFCIIGISIDFQMMLRKFTFGLLQRGLWWAESFWVFPANEQPETLLRKANGM